GGCGARGSDEDRFGSPRPEDGDGARSLVLPDRQSRPWRQRSWLVALPQSGRRSASRSNDGQCEEHRESDVVLLFRHVTGAPLLNGGVPAPRQARFTPRDPFARSVPLALRMRLVFSLVNRASRTALMRRRSTLTLLIVAAMCSLLFGSARQTSVSEPPKPALTPWGPWVE